MLDFLFCFQVPPGSVITIFVGRSDRIFDTESSPGAGLAWTVHWRDNLPEIFLVCFQHPDLALSARPVWLLNDYLINVDILVHFCLNLLQ